MEPSKEPLAVVFTSTARTDLVAVWEWNATTYSVNRADRYLDFLESEIMRLSRSPESGSLVEGFTEVRRHLAKRKSRGHGHLIFYRVRDMRVEIIAILHTAQDWPTRLAESDPQ